MVVEKRKIVQRHVKWDIMVKQREYRALLPKVCNQHCIITMCKDKEYIRNESRERERKKMREKKNTKSEINKGIKVMLMF